MESTSDIPAQSQPRWAQIISDIFSPLLVPTYGMALAMWITTLRNIPEENRLVATLLVGVITGMIPFISIAVLIRIGRVHNNSISNRHERVIPMSIAVGCYVAAAIFLGSIGAPIWLRMFFVGASVTTAIALIITLWWKISAHCSAIGGIIGMVLWCAVAGLADINVMIVLSAVIVIAGMVATSRMILGRHSFSQVVAGLALGLTCCFCFMWIH